MKRTIFDEPAFKEITDRIQKLTTDTKGKWGKLSVVQMIRHLNEAGRMAFDEVIVPDQSNLFTKTIVKWMFLQNIKPPGREKGKIKTFKEIDIVALGTACSDLESEKKTVITLLHRMRNSSNLSNRHPLFGKMSRDDWGYLTYAHSDYHLTQFGI